MVFQGDFYLTTCGGKIFRMENTVEELGLEDWVEEVVVGRLRGGGTGGVGGWFGWWWRFRRLPGFRW